METSTVTVKGQIVVPVNIRRKFGMKKGTKVDFLERDGKLMIQPLNIENLAGILGTKGKMLRSLMEEKKRERRL